MPSPIPLQTLGTAGGLFALLTFNHFLVDWGFQTHHEAMRKASNWRWRARHCAIYTVGFLPLFWLMGYGPAEYAIGCAVLFISHFIEDTYIPVYLWARHIRQMPPVHVPGRLRPEYPAPARPGRAAC